MPRTRKVEFPPGCKVGDWTVLSELEAINYRRRFLCRCKCGTEKVVWFTHLGVTSKHCRKCNEGRPNSKWPAVEVGQQIGWWTVVRKANTKHKRAYFWCKCRCGLEKMIAGANLSRGTSFSCGCGKNHFQAITVMKRYEGVFINNRVGIVKGAAR